MESLGKRALDVAFKELGVAEDPPRSNTGPRIREYLEPCVRGDRNVKLGLKASNWCFTGDTEILTEEGWMRLDDVSEDVQVAQVHPRSMRISLTRTVAVIHKAHKGALAVMSRRSLRLVSDPEHRYFGKWWVSARSGRKDVPEVELRPVADLTGAATKLVVPPSRGHFEYESGWSRRDLKLLGAFLADGSIVNGKLQFQVSRADKIAMLHELEPDRVWEAPMPYGPRSKEALTSFFFEMPSEFAEAFDKYKVLSPRFMWNLHREQAALVLDTWASYDGSARGGSIRLSQASKDRIDTAQMLAVLAGYSGQTQKPKQLGEFGSTMHFLTYVKGPRNTEILDKNVRLTEEQEVDLYCVQVPSGLIIVRPSGYGRALVVGNCMAFSSWCMTEALEDGEVPPHGYRAGVVEAVADVRSPHAKFSGVWHPVETVRKKLWTPFEGDLAIWDRSTTDPNTSWWRHVNRVVKYDAGVGEFDTIGGNERDQVRVAAHHVSEIKLLGFIAYPQPEDKPEPKQIDALTHANLLGLVARTIDGMLRDSHTEMMESHHMDDDDYDD